MLLKILAVLAGLIVGGALGEAPGAVIGGVGAWFLVQGMRRKGAAPTVPGESEAGAPRDARQAEWGRGTAADAPALEARVAALEAQVRELVQRIDVLTGRSTAPARAIDEAPAAAAVPDAQPTAVPAFEASVAVPASDASAAVPASEADAALAARAARRETDLDGIMPNDASRDALPVREPPPPDAIQRGLAAARAWLFGGNTVARLGILVLFVGLTFLARYAIEHAILPPAARIAIIAVVAIALLGIGWRLRERRTAYAMILQGGAVAALYLDVFAAYRLYQLVPAGAAFALAAAICAFAAVLAVRQDALALAVLGVAGGFLSPILASTGQGSHVALFSFYLLLDLGILAIARMRSWRVLYLVGFAFTFVIGGLWGWRYYRPEFFATVQPFLAAFVLLFVAIAVLEARKARERAAGVVDGALVFGPPIVGFSLQAALVRDFEFGAAWSAVAFGAAYLLLAAVWLRGRGAGRASGITGASDASDASSVSDTSGTPGAPVAPAAPAFDALFGLALAAIGAGFATMAVPLAFDARVTAAVWALEGAGALWFGTRQSRPWPVVCGLALQLAAGFAFLSHPDAAVSTPVLNARWIGALLVAAAGAFSAWHLRGGIAGVRGPLAQFSPWVSPLMLGWALVWWLGGGIAEIDAWPDVDDARRVASVLGLFALTAAALLLANARLAWTHAAFAALGLAPLMVLGAFALADAASHPAQSFAWVGWLAVFAVHERVLRATDERVAGWIANAQHALRAVLAIALLAWQADWLASRATGAAAWSIAASGAVLAAGSLALGSDRLASRWPVRTRPLAYRGWAAWPVALALGGWIAWASLDAGALDTAIAYLPLLNPVDLASLAAAAAAWRWTQTCPQPDSLRRWTRAAAALAAFAVLNAIVLRAVSRFGAVRYDVDALAAAPLAQTSISLLWGATALVLMAFGARRAQRGPWIAGAGLLALEIAKLFFFDLGDVNGLTRVVSFVGVGALMLLIGYVAPLPPRRAADDGGDGGADPRTV